MRVTRCPSKAIYAETSENCAAFILGVLCVVILRSVLHAVFRQFTS